MSNAYKVSRPRRLRAETNTETRRITFMSMAESWDDDNVLCSYLCHRITHARSSLGFRLVLRSGDVRVCVFLDKRCEWNVQLEHGGMAFTLCRSVKINMKSNSGILNSGTRKLLWDSRVGAEQLLRSKIEEVSKSCLTSCIYTVFSACATTWLYRSLRWSNMMVNFHKWFSFFVTEGFWDPQMAYPSPVFQMKNSKLCPFSVYSNSNGIRPSCNSRLSNLVVDNGSPMRLDLRAELTLQRLDRVKSRQSDWFVLRNVKFSRLRFVFIKILTMSAAEVHTLQVRAPFSCDVSHFLIFLFG